MNDPTIDLDRLARCPRCGYDLRGAIESWAEACPLDGVCAECGLAFEWRELLSDRFRPPAWCVEYPRDPWQWPGRFISTWLMCARPARFWSELRMMHPLRIRPLLLSTVAVLALLYVVFALSMGVAATRCWPFNTRGAYVPTVPKADIAFHAALYPLSTRSRGMARPTGPNAGGPPLGLVAPRWVLVDAYLTFKQLRMAFLYAIACFLVCPLGFLALPQSRKQAKVRWRHIFRIFLYSGGAGAVLMILMLLAGPDRMKIQSGGTPLFAQSVLPVVVVGSTVYLFVWWSRASSRYLRMAHPWAVGLAVIIMASLVGGILMMWTYTNGFLGLA